MVRRGFRAGPISVCYVTVDVVDFSKGRIASAQVEIVERLKGVVRRAVDMCGLTPDTVYRPSGDAVCLCIVRPNPTNEDLRVALAILEETWNLSEQESVPTLKFSLRVGINQNTDNAVKDINGKWDFIGAGINDCHNLMRVAGAQQIVVSDSAWNRLRVRERPVPGELYTLPTWFPKHSNAPRTLYQFRAVPPIPYLSSDPPPPDAFERFRSALGPASAPSAV